MTSPPRSCSQQHARRDGRRVREAAEVHHHRLVAGDTLRRVEERRHLGIAWSRHARTFMPDDDVGVGRHRLRGRRLVEVALVVGDLELVADEVLGGEVDLARVHECEDPRAHLGVVDPLAGQTERRHAAGAAVDDHRHALAHAHPVGVQAEVTEARVHVHVQVDEARRHQQVAAVDHLGLGPGRVVDRADGGDRAVLDQDVAHLVVPTAGDPAPARPRARHAS